MKTKIFALSIALMVAGFYSCTKDDNNPTPTTPTKVDRKDTISMGASYANDIYYSFKDSVVAVVPRANWDIAFSVSTRSSSIIINDGSGVTLKAFPNAWTWGTAIDTTGYHSWPSLFNADSTWEEGAFNKNATGHPNYGWGNYDMTTHNINGVALYIIQLRNGSFKKIFIETKFSALQQYTFKYSNIDGTDEHVVSNLDASASKANYVYYSLQDNAVVADREPDASTWDILFTKYTDNTLSYIVTGVLQNNGVPAIKVTADDPNTITYTDTQFDSHKSVIGYDWKSINMTTYKYDVPANRYYIVKDKSGVAYRLHFTSFAGSSTGKMTFEVKQL